MSSLKASAYRRRRSDNYLQKAAASEISLVSASDPCDKLPGTSQNKDTTLSQCHFSLGAYKGLLYTFLCSLFITLSSAIVKKLDYISPGELSLVRNFGVFLGCLPIITYKWHNLLGPPNYRILLLIRGFLGATALYLNLLAFRILPLAEAATILSSLPTLVMVLARFVLKESCGVVQCIALFLTLTGVLLSIRIPVIISDGKLASTIDANFITGVSCAVGCVLLLSVTFVALRKMREIHFSVVLIYLGFIGILENAGLTAALSFFTIPRCGADKLWVILIAVFGCLGHCFLTLAVQAEEVGMVSVMKASIDIVIAMVLQIIFFEQIPDIYNFSGASLVILSVGILGMRKWLSNKKDSDPVKRKLKFLLL